MAPGQITVDDIRKRFVSKVLAVRGDKEALWQALTEHSQFTVQNYSRLTPEAKEISDQLVKTMIDEIEVGISALPDSTRKRFLKRSVRDCRGERLIAKSHMMMFDVPAEEIPIYERAKGIFEDQLQILMDFYQDISEESFSGPAVFSQVALLGVCLDELLVAFALAQRSFPGQAMQHLRTIQEALDLVRLFREQPEWAKLWTSQKPWQEIWNELSPGKVRKKIKSHSTYREIYESLSSLGTHPSFEMVRLRVHKKSDSKEGQKPQIQIRLGGIPGAKENITAHCLILLLMASLLAELIGSFGQRLHIEEIKSALVKFIKAFGDFALEFMAKPMQLKGVKEAHEFEEFLKSHLAKIENGVFFLFGGKS